MAKITINNQVEPSTPSSGKTSLYVDSVDKHLKQKDDAGVVIDITQKGSILVDSEYIYGTTSDPNTTATTPATAYTIDEMTRTFTPSAATNIIEIFFNGVFGADDKAEQQGAFGLFLDGTLITGTQVDTGLYQNVLSGDAYPEPCSTAWLGSLTAEEHTIDVRMWSTSSKNIWALSTERILIFKEWRP